MAETYLKRLDVGYPKNIVNGVGTYFIKFFTNQDLKTLQDEVNEWLIGLPQTSAQWMGHLIDTQYHTFTQNPGNKTIHAIKVTLFIVGSIKTIPAQAL